MKSHPPLPPVIGRTENTLRALLLQTLTGSPVRSYPTWVAVNHVSEQPCEVAKFTAHLAEVFKSSDDDAGAVAQQLLRSGLLQITASGYVLTDLGRSALRQGRQQVGAATARLTEGLIDTDIDITVATLETIRVNAERELQMNRPTGASR